MNIFSVLGVNYETFHTRMLKWLWTPDGDHGGGESFLLPLLTMLDIPFDKDYRIAAEVVIHGSRGAKWRLADLVIRTREDLVLIENKVDPVYQDAAQIVDEVEGGRRIAANEHRRFHFVLIAPGPLSADMEQAVSASNGKLVPWTDVLAMLRQVSRASLDRTADDIIGQYLIYCEARKATAGAVAADAPLLRDCAEALRELVSEVVPGDTLTATQVWPRFLERFPDHAAALDSRWADSTHYSTKSWFAAKLQRLAANQELIEDTGEWHSADTTTWGFSRVRVYRRLSGT